MMAAGECAPPPFDFEIFARSGWSTWPEIIAVRHGTLPSFRTHFTIV